MISNIICKEIMLSFSYKPRPPKKISKKSVGVVLGRQPENRDVKPNILADYWCASKVFHLMSISIDKLCSATKPYGKPITKGPIIVDFDKNDVGVYPIGKPVLILDGKHRWLEAGKKGNKDIKAYVGDKAVPHLIKNITVI